MKHSVFVKCVLVGLTCLISAFLLACESKQQVKKISRNNVTIKVPAPENMVFINDKQISAKAVSLIPGLNMFEEMVLKNSIFSAKKKLSKKSSAPILTACSSSEVASLLTKKNSGVKLSDVLALEHRSFSLVFDITDFFYKDSNENILKQSFMEYLLKLDANKKNKIAKFGPNYLIQTKQSVMGSQISVVGKVFYKNRVYGLLYCSLAPGLDKVEEIKKQGERWIEEFAALNK